MDDKGGDVSLRTLKYKFGKAVFLRKKLGIVDKTLKPQRTGMLVRPTEGTNLPITVRLILRFRVGVLRKSTRHRYIPSSDRATSSTSSCAGVDAVLKYALVPNAVGADHSLA